MRPSQAKEMPLKSNQVIKHNYNHGDKPNIFSFLFSGKFVLDMVGEIEKDISSLPELFQDRSLWALFRFA
jgi:hypothetical protein